MRFRQAGIAFYSSIIEKTSANHFLDESLLIEAWALQTISTGADDGLEAIAIDLRPTCACRGPETSGSRGSDGGVTPMRRTDRTDLLSVEKVVCSAGSRLCSPLQAAPQRKDVFEEVGSGSSAGESFVAGVGREKF